MQIIGHDEIMGLKISPIQCFEWVDKIIKSKDRVILPAKISLKPSEGVFYNTMPVLLPEEGWGGVKLVNRYPGRTPSLDSKLMLYSMETGYLVALMDANFITTMRTGAVAAHSVYYLAKPDFKTLGIMGLGNTARAAMKVLAALYPERELVVKLLKYKNQHEEFKNIFQNYKNIEFRVCENVQELVRSSDVIISAATYLDHDVCEDECFSEGCLLVPIHTRGFTNCDLFFDKVFADDRAHVQGFKYFNRFRYFAEMTDVVNGRVPGRTDDKERILAYNIGIAAHDFYFAGKIYNMISKKNNIEISAPHEKWYVY